MFYSRLRVKCGEDFTEILMAELAEAGFDSFIETNDGFEAYVEMEQYDKGLVPVVIEKYKSVTPLTIEADRVEKQNWNEEWEKNYEPVIVDGRCRIRASFHPSNSQYEREIIITPKMSFGTGHHQTTYLMLRHQLDIGFRNKRVMDAGCGTAILSIMASLSGASEVFAFDIDDWSIENGSENISENGCSNITLQKGKIGELNIQGKFDIILANINKNVLLAEINVYQTFMRENGLLLISGFYVDDIDELVRECERFAMVEERREEKDNWASLQFRKR